MKISSLKNLPFQKRLVANCAVKGQNTKIPCSIYQLELEDENYFEYLSCANGWKNGEYILSADYDIRDGYINSMYVIEDKNNRCLGYTELVDAGDDRNVIEFFEVKPICRCNNKKRAKKYVGETLLNFAVQMSKKLGKDIVHVVYPVSSAYDFYTKCGFKKDDKDVGLKINTNEGQELADKNFEHTNSRIEFVV